MVCIISINGCYHVSRKGEYVIIINLTDFAVLDATRSSRKITRGPYFVFVEHCQHWQQLHTHVYCILSHNLYTNIQGSLYDMHNCSIHMAHNPSVRKAAYVPEYRVLLKAQLHGSGSWSILNSQKACARNSIVRICTV